MVTFTPQVARLANGLSLPYVEQGATDGLPLVCLHGYTDSWRSFEALLPHMPAHLRVIALTQRGHGDASRPEQGYAPADFAGDVAQFLDVLEIDKAVIIGHSMGSGVAQRVTIEYPERVRGLVLIGSSPTASDKPGIQEFWESGVSQLQDPIDPAFARDFQESTLYRPIDPDYLDALIAESLKVPARVWKAAFYGLLTADHSAQLRDIRVPTLLLWGDQDGFATRADQDRLLELIPNTQLRAYTGTGHAPHWEEPATVATDLFAFIDSTQS